jgi:RimJ/RimL family protein N-acetyltransferase
MESNRKINYYINFKNLDKKTQMKILKWRNQFFVRKSMITNNIISEEEHIKFLILLNHSKEKQNYLFFFNNKPIGVFYYSFKNHLECEFGYYLIDENFVSSGYGILIEYIALKIFFEKNENYSKKFFCRTRKDNSKVINLHKKLGFLSEKEIFINNNTYLHQEIDKITWDKNKETIRNMLEKVFKIDINEVKEWKKN